MRPIRRAAVTGLMALWLAPLPALAGSQSSNSSSNCSDGHCSRVESFVVQDRYGRQGWVRQDHWREGYARRWRHEPRDAWRDDRPYLPWGYAPRPRDRDDDDDD
ncbi:hypothetical protein [Falsiroseomonas oryzae]|uniref:hypothetical protein n=1 Tax=Falsiroseomonas oryzae TaxID=2766473 RepID=UPI0022EAAEEA|nr:hypothetical protein [Roseomonas sp. MO-31]